MEKVRGEKGRKCEGEKGRKWRRKESGKREGIRRARGLRLFVVSINYSSFKTNPF